MLVVSMKFRGRFKLFDTRTDEDVAEVVIIEVGCNVVRIGIQAPQHIQINVERNNVLRERPSSKKLV